MANLKFNIRKSKGKASIYIRYRPNRSIDFNLKTPFTIEANHWDKESENYDITFKKRSPKTSEEKKLNVYIDNFNSKLIEFKNELDKFIINSDFNVSRESLTNFIQTKYNLNPKPQKQKPKTIPTLFSDFIEYYIEEKSTRIVGKQKPLSEASIKKFRVIKHKLQKINPNLTVEEIDDQFRKEFSKWCLKNKYAESTIIKESKFIKMFCVYASKKLEVSKEVLLWDFIAPKKKYKEPILTFQELDRIEHTILPHDYLTNARDWLIIGCYSAQRVSDLLRFENANIIDGEYLEFTQQKGDNPIVIYMLPKVQEIIKRRGGKFPRKISDQRFNDYIKEVCKIAGIDEVITGGKMIDKRKVVGEYPKYELVTSHICRRSFVTNFRTIIGDESIMATTGHTTTKMLNTYDKNTELQIAKRTKEVINARLKIS